MLINIFNYTFKFPISRDPPEGGTRSRLVTNSLREANEFPISRDPPEGGTLSPDKGGGSYGTHRTRFQFLGIPPKGEQQQILKAERCAYIRVSNF
jgi:hypothetical protein